MASLVPWRRPNATHGIIQARLAFLITRHLETRSSSCVVVTEPAIQPRVRARSNIRVPDLAVTCSPVEAGQIVLPEPVLIVEILSPTNESDTWENVWTYVSIPSVQEVLVLRSTSIAAELLRTAHGRHLARRAEPDRSRRNAASGVYRPDLPACRSLHRDVSRTQRVTLLNRCAAATIYAAYPRAC